MVLKKKLAAGLVAAATLATVACSAGGNVDQKGSGSAAASGAKVVLKDVTGRSVELDKKPERVVLGEGRGMFAAALLDPKNPTEHVVALGSDLHTAAPTFEEKLFQVAPKAKDLPTIGNAAKGDVTVENLVALKPDVIVFTLDHKKAIEKNGFLDKVDQAGLKYVFTDFRQKPLENTTKSVELLGQVLDEEKRAKEFTDFYNAQVADVKARVADVKEKPRTLVWRAAGLKDCCATVKNSNLGDLVNAAGGTNIGDTLLDQESGDLTAEKVVAEQPEVIIATGGSWAKDPKKPEVLPHVELGYKSSDEAAEKTLAGLLATPGFDALKAPKEGELHAAFHQFYDSPYNVFALQQFAKWLHPDKFEDVDPAKNFADFHKEWLPIEYSGTFFATHNGK